MDEELRSKIVNQEPLNQAYASSDFAQGIERGKFMERERIIKLLEDARNKCACYREVGMPICRHQLSVDEQTTLIKGENK